jgi:hypothetical protein
MHLQTVISHAADLVQLLTLIALIWYATETRLIRREDRSYHRLERRIDYYFFIRRQEEPTKTDLLRFAEGSKPRQADAIATVANLGRLPLLLEGIMIQSRIGGPRSYTLPPVVVNTDASVQFIVADLIVRYLHELGSLSESTPPESRSWSGELEISLKFYARGTSRISEAQRYAIGISFDSVQTMHLIQRDAEDKPARLTRSALDRE